LHFKEIFYDTDMKNKIQKIVFTLVFSFLGIEMIAIPPVFANPTITAIPLQTRIPRNGVSVPVLSIIIRTHDDPLNIDEIHIRRTGLSSSDDVEGLRAQTREMRTRRAPMLSDDIAKIQVRPTLEIPAQSREQIVITANFQFEESNRTIGFELEKLITVDNSAEINITQKQNHIQQSKTRTTSQRYRNSSIQTKNKITKPRYAKAYRYRGSRNYQALRQR
jgi:hypothetical protein